MEKLSEKIEDLKFMAAHLQYGQEEINEMVELNSALLKIEEQMDNYDHYLEREFEAVNSHQSLMELLLKQNQELTLLLKQIPESKILESQSQPEVEVINEQKPIQSPLKSNQPTEKRDPIELLSATEFKALPSYLVGRLTIDKINQLISQLNRLVLDKVELLSIPVNRMVPAQKEVYWANKEIEKGKGQIFVTEKDLKEKRFWSKSEFNYGSTCRTVLTILRSVGRTKEIREKGNTFFIITQ